MPFSRFPAPFIWCSNSLLVVSLKTWSIVLHVVHAAKVGSKMNAQYCFFLNLIRGFLLQQVLQKHL